MILCARARVRVLCSCSDAGRSVGRSYPSFRSCLGAKWARRFHSSPEPRSIRDWRSWERRKWIWRSPNKEGIWWCARKIKWELADSIPETFTLEAEQVNVPTRTRIRETSKVNRNNNYESVSLPRIVNWTNLFGSSGHAIKCHSKAKEWHTHSYNLKRNPMQIR